MHTRPSIISAKKVGILALLPVVISHFGLTDFIVLHATQVWFKNRRAKCRQQQKAAEQVSKSSSVIKGTSTTGNGSSTIQHQQQQSTAITPATSSVCCKTPPSGSDSTNSDDETLPTSYAGGADSIHWLPSRDCWPESPPGTVLSNYYMTSHYNNSSSVPPTRPTSGYSPYAVHHGYYGNGVGLCSRSYDSDAGSVEMAAELMCRSGGGGGRVGNSGGIGPLAPYSHRRFDNSGLRCDLEVPWAASMSDGRSMQVCQTPGINHLYSL